MEKLPNKITAMLAISYDVDIIKKFYYSGIEDVRLSDIIHNITEQLYNDVPLMMHTFVFFDEDGNQIDSSAILKDNITLESGE
jgi:hypothetical protein